MPPAVPLTLRLDLWLWSVRACKTRPLATELCREGRVQVNGQPAKPARDLRGGETVTVDEGLFTRTLQVVGLPPGRVGAPLVAGYCTDLTTPEERAKRVVSPVQRLLARPVGAGRPTKRERRHLDQWLG